MGRVLNENPNNRTILTNRKNGLLTENTFVLPNCSPPLN